MATSNVVVSKLIAAFVTLILGVSLIGTIAAQTLTDTTTTNVVDETVSLATIRAGVGNGVNDSLTVTTANLGLNDAGGWLAGSVNVSNSSGATLAGNFTVNYNTQKINFTNGTYFINSFKLDNSSKVDYQYYPNSYVQQAFGRTVLLLIGGFFALILMGVSVGLFYLIAKDTGML